MEENRSGTGKDGRIFGRLAYSVLLLSAGATLAMIRVLSPTSLEADVLFSIWLLFPYVMMSVLLRFLSGDHPSAVAHFAVTLLVSLGGLHLLVDIIFFHPDAQGPIALLLVPVIQAGGIVVLTPVARFLCRRYFKYRGELP